MTFGYNPDISLFYVRLYPYTYLCNRNFRIPIEKLRCIKQLLLYKKDLLMFQI